MKRLVLTVIVVGLIITVVVVIDVSSPPKPTKGQCLLAKRILLPDVCVNSCPQFFDCTATTRPYGFFFTQAATCADAVICSAGTNPQLSRRKFNHVPLATQRSADSRFLDLLLFLAKISFVPTDNGRRTGFL